MCSSGLGWSGLPGRPARGTSPGSEKETRAKNAREDACRRRGGACGRQRGRAGPGGPRRRRAEQALRVRREEEEEGRRAPRHQEDCEQLDPQGDVEDREAVERGDEDHGWDREVGPLVAVPAAARRQKDGA